MSSNRRMKTYLPAFLTNPISANTCWQMSQQKHSGCQLLLIALITRPIMNSPVRNTMTRIYNTTLDKVKRNPQVNHYNCIIILSSYTAHLPPNLVEYINNFSVAVLVLNSVIWVVFVCFFFFFVLWVRSRCPCWWTTFCSLYISLFPPSLCNYPFPVLYLFFFSSDLKLLQNIQSSLYNMAFLSPYHLCLSPLIEEDNFKLSFTQ